MSSRPLESCHFATNAEEAATSENASFQRVVSFLRPAGLLAENLLG
jgi:hypothetical protein